MQAMYIGCLLTYPAVTGNPLIRTEMQLTAQIKDLKMEKSHYMEKIYDLQDNIRVKMPEDIQRTESGIAKMSADYKTAQNAAKLTVEGKEFYPITIDGRTYEDKKLGAEILKNKIIMNKSRVAEGKNVEIGEYRGMKLALTYDPLNQKVKADLFNQKHYYCDLNPDTDIGNITRLDNLIDNIGKTIESEQEKLTRMKSELEQMKVDVEKPFPKAEELFLAETQLEEVHEQLTQFEMEDDSAARDMFDRLNELFPLIMDGKTEHISYTAEGMEKLNVEMHGTDFSICQTYEQNGDLMYDPLVYFKIDYEHEKAIPISFENSGTGVYEVYDTENPSEETAKQIGDLMDNVDNWLDRIEDDGYLNNPVTEKSFDQRKEDIRM